MQEHAFDREDSHVMKGIGIVLMLMHHLWGFPDRIAGGGLRSLLTFGDQSAALYLGTFGKICVSLFFFLGGYGLACRYRGRRFDLIGRIRGLYISYWRVFLIFIPIAFLFFRHQPVYCGNEGICSRYAVFSRGELFQNFLGLSTSYNEEWWFLQSYVGAIILFPVIRFLCDRFSAAVAFALTLAASVLMQNVFPALGNLSSLGSPNGNYLYYALLGQGGPHFICFWMGVLMAKDGLLLRLRASMESHALLRPIPELLLIAGIVYLRESGPGDTLDFLYVPVLTVASLDLMCRLPLLRRAALRLGEESTNMWLIHTFLCYYFYQTARLVAAPGWAVPSLIILVAASYVCSVAVTCFWRLAGRISGAAGTRRMHRNE